MKRSSTISLRAAIVLIGIGALFTMLWEPLLEGRNAHATLFQVYFNDPFLAYVYAASLCFFVALYQAFKLLERIGRNEAFSQRSVRAVRTIRDCAITLSALIMGAEACLFVFQRGQDDIAGGVAIGGAMMFLFFIAAAAADVFEGILRSVVPGVRDEAGQDLS